MAVELMGFAKMDDQMAIRHAASQGLKSMEHLIRRMSRTSNQSDCADLTDNTVSKFKEVISLLNRTGHARFRRGPANSSSSASTSSSGSGAFHPVARLHTQSLAPAPATVRPPPVFNPATLPQSRIAAPVSFVQSQSQTLTLDFTKPNLFTSNAKSTELDFSKDTFSLSSNSSFVSSAITGDCSVSNGKEGSSLLLHQAVSAGKPPLSSAPYKKRCRDHDRPDDVSGKFSGSGGAECHCAKRRYLFVFHVPAHFSMFCLSLLAFDRPYSRKKLCYD
ncbi:WRKY transcription factor 43.2 [Tripterygium wilfordii]|uniref:WRKY transcription factor 43.2 n=1 Tax=Tripterygium wilfordii TaxID=458696 RepID=A0A7J7DAV9_TRIWF|nr:WRKY transcription factor 43.2 [Tripterygium wilfordii]